MGLKIRRKSGTKILLSCFQGSMWDLQVACIRVRKGFSKSGCGSDFKVFRSSELSEMPSNYSVRLSENVCWFNVSGVGVESLVCEEGLRLNLRFQFKTLGFWNEQQECYGWKQWGFSSYARASLRISFA